MYSMIIFKKKRGGGKLVTSCKQERFPRVLFLWIVVGCIVGGLTPF